MAREAHIYLDESGDTGWSFVRPYTRGGSSSYLVITACIAFPSGNAKPERLIRNLYKHREWKASSEKKWSGMSPSARTEFATTAAKMLDTATDISLHAIVVDKSLIGKHVHREPSALYNYMVRRLLLSEMAIHDRVHFRPDPRSIKVDSGRSLHDYLQTELWFTAGSSTILETVSLDSRSSPNLQFVDMVSGVVHAHFEFGETRNWQVLAPHIRVEKMNFGE